MFSDTPELSMILVLYSLAVQPKGSSMILVLTVFSPKAVTHVFENRLKYFHILNGICTGEFSGLLLHKFAMS